MQYHTMKSCDFFKGNSQACINRAEVTDVCVMHTHDFIEMAYVISGSGRHCVGGQSFAIAKGDLFLINSSVPHSYLNDTDASTPLLFYNCIFQPPFVDSSLSNCTDFIDSAYYFFFNQLVRDQPTHTDFIIFPPNPAYEFLIAEMYREFQAKEEGYIHLIRANLGTLFIKAFRAYACSRPAREAMSPARRDMVEKIIQYINKNYSKPIQLSNLSARAFLSPAYFSRLFKDYTSQTLTQFIQSQRIAAACSLLETSDMSVENISAEVGYQDAKYFYEIFQKAMGITPGQYRKNSRQKR